MTVELRLRARENEASNVPSAFRYCRLSTIRPRYHSTAVVWWDAHLRWPAWSRRRFLRLTASSCVGDPLTAALSVSLLPTLVLLVPVDAMLLAMVVLVVIVLVVVLLVEVAAGS